jgi:hypothetical protein
MTDILNPEFGLPFTLTADGAVEVEQGSPAEIAQCAFALLSVELGSMPDMPTFGIPSPLFRVGGQDITLLEQAITASDPRANIVISQDPNWISTLVQTISIQGAAPSG